MECPYPHKCEVSSVTIFPLIILWLFPHFFFQEEDLFIMAYGLPLSGDGDDKCLSMLNAVEETICRQLRACKSPRSRASEGNLLIPNFNNFFCLKVKVVYFVI